MKLSRLLITIILLGSLSGSSMLFAQRTTGPKFKNTPTHERVSSHRIVAGNKLCYKGPSAKQPLHERSADTTSTDLKREEILKGPKAKNKKPKKK